MTTNTAATRSIDPRSIFVGVVYTLLVVGYIFRAFYVAEYPPSRHIWSDPQRHWEQGIDVLRDDPMALTDPVLYQLYVSVIGKLTYGDGVLVAFYTILLAFVMPWLWYRFFRELQPSKDIALVGWVMITWLPSWLSIYGYYMQETLMLPLMGGALWATWRCHRKQTLNAFMLMVFIWVLAGLTRGVCIPMAAVAASWMWFTQDKKIQKALLSVAILAVTLGPLTYRSYQKMKLISPHGIGLMNMIYAKSGKKEIQIKYSRSGAVWYYGYGSPSTGTRPFEPFSDWHTARAGKVYVDIDIDKGSKDWDRQFDSMDLSFKGYLWLTSESLAFLLFDPSWPDSNLEYPLGFVNYHLRWIWAPLGLITIALTLYTWRKYPKKFRSHQWLLASIFTAWFIVQAFALVAVNEGRYRKPYEGLVIAQLVLLASFSRRLGQYTNTVTGPDSEQNPDETPLSGDETLLKGA